MLWNREKSPAAVVDWFYKSDEAHQVVHGMGVSLSQEEEAEG